MSWSNLSFRVRSFDRNFGQINIVVDFFVFSAAYGFFSILTWWVISPILCSPLFLLRCENWFWFLLDWQLLEREYVVAVNIPVYLVLASCVRILKMRGLVRLVEKSMASFNLDWWWLSALDSLKFALLSARLFLLWSHFF